MLPKDYLIYRLSGNFATDYSDASGMLLLDVKRRCWSQQMLSICGITEQQLPKLHESYEVVGTLLPQLAEQLGLPSSVRIIAGAGDNAAAATFRWAPAGRCSSPADSSVWTRTMPCTPLPMPTGTII